MKGPIRVWVNRFDDETVRRLASAIERAAGQGQEVLPVFILSPGGSVYHLIAMQDLFESAKKQGIGISTIALGSAASAAADLLASGTKGIRFVAEGTTVMVHQGSDWVPPRKVHEMASDMREAERLDALAFARMDANTGKRSGFWQAHLATNGNVDLYLAPAQVLELGIADHIGLPVVVHQRPQTALMAETAPEPKPRKRRPRR